jgi:transcriptional regulator with XRE-family HTH domain
MTTTRKNPKIYLAEWRGFRGMTQRQLARLSGVSPATIEKMEMGDSVKHRPYPHTINALAETLGVMPRQLWSPPPADVAESAA